MKLFRKSQQLFILSFIGLIGIGTLLLQSALWFEDKQLAWIDALFVATSAVCVTGLSPVYISQFNFGAQLILLLLIQLGAIGLMTLTSLLIIMVRREMNLDNKMLISGIVESYSGKELDKLLYVIIFYTFVIELIGWGLLTFGFMVEMKAPLHHAVYLGFFHSISAFCNAGFSPFDDSLMRAGPIVKIVVGGLIVCGGLGFYVIYDLWQVIHKGAFMKVYTKLVLVTSTILILVGMFGLKIFEYAEGGGISWLDSLFQSVTARTAGFNTIDLNQLHPSSIMLIIALMLIGASPGSTGGGMKTTVFALAFLAIFKTFAGEREVTLFRRQIATPSVLKAFSIMFVFISLSIVGMIMLSIYEDMPPYVMMFEAVSALGTVGLSLGLTAKASIGGKLVLIVLMFLGRIGPFTFFLFLLSREKNSRLQYPEERVIMG